jgi:hypothetical protein
LALRAWRRAAVGGAQHGGGADESRRWEPMEAGGESRWKLEAGAVPGQKAKRSGPVSVGVNERRKWAERQKGSKAKEAAA